MILAIPLSCIFPVSDQNFGDRPRFFQQLNLDITRFLRAYTTTWNLQCVFIMLKRKHEQNICLRLIKCKTQYI